jgi:hypothetical protein
MEPRDFPRFLESIVLHRFNPCLKFHSDVSRTLPNLFLRLLRQEDGCDHDLLYTYKVNISTRGALLKAASNLSIPWSTGGVGYLVRP